jgi:hypothetical protein
MTARADVGTNLQNSLIKDILFVAIDIDTFQGYDIIILDQLFHIGIPIFDTRSLQDLVISWPGLKLKSGPENSPWAVRSNIYFRAEAKT